MACLKLVRGGGFCGRHTVVDIPAGPVTESNFFEWEALIMGPKDTPFEGGVFAAKLTFVRMNCRFYASDVHSLFFIAPRLPTFPVQDEIRSASVPSKQ